MKNIKLTILGVATLLFALTLNFRHAIDDYGISKNKLHVEVLAQTNDTGGDSTDGGDSTTNQPLWCSTFDKYSNMSWGFGTCGNGEYYAYVSMIHVVRSCTNGKIGFCFPGTITSYYDACGNTIGSDSNTTTSTCSSSYIP